MTWERIKYLIGKSNSGIGLSTLEADELDKLRANREDEIIESILRPRCCEEAIKFPIISFIVSGNDPDIIGSWQAHVGADFFSLFEFNGRYPPVKFCPYCRTELPKMVLKERPIDSHICKITDGGYYCDTCEERLNMCFCDSRTTLFEPASTTYKLVL
jgi:hypothetical protein